jgi:hypothetical protein
LSRDCPDVTAPVPAGRPDVTGAAAIEAAGQDVIRPDSIQADLAAWEKIARDTRLDARA